jgi:hypothetical protein
MWSKERFVTFIEDLESNACLRDVHCADYKNLIENGDTIIFSQKHMKSALSKMKKIANL